MQMEAPHSRHRACAHTLELKQANSAGEVKYNDIVEPQCIVIYDLKFHLHSEVNKCTA